MMHWRKDCTKRLAAKDWIPRVLPFIVWVPIGDVPFSRTAISEALWIFPVPLQSLFMQNDVYRKPITV